jgi:hypothetical protein
MEAADIEARRLRSQCSAADAADDMELLRLRQRYVRLLESEPVPSDALRRDIRRDLARSVSDDTRAMVVALLLAALGVIAFSHWMAVVAPALHQTVGFALQAGLLLTIPAIAATEASRWRSSLRTASRRELDALLPEL